MKSDVKRYAKIVLLTFSAVLIISVGYFFYRALSEKNYEVKLEEFYELLNSGSPFYAKITLDAFVLEVQVLSSEDYILIATFGEEKTETICVDNQAKTFYNSELVEENYCESIDYGKLVYDEIYTEEEITFEEKNDLAFGKVGDDYRVEFHDDYFFYELIISGEKVTYEIKEGMILEQNDYLLY